jgi:hypothetical protein
VSTVLGRKLIALVTAAVLSMAVPTAALADQGGVPHSTKPCPSKGKGKGPKKGPPNGKGKKCGFNRVNGV